MIIEKRLAAAVLLTLTVIVASGCSTRMKSVAPKLENDLQDLRADLEVLPPFPEPTRGSGSLWTDAGPGAAKFRDTTAFRINDLLTVQLVESTSGTNGATTELERSSANSYSAPFVFGLQNPDLALETDLSTEFIGDGVTSRSSQLVGTVTTRVVRVLPNGDLIVAGQKTVMINREKQILTLVGSVRPVDINADNTVASPAVGNLTVRMWGNGEIDDSARQGWFMRILSRIWPF